jgi:hypothetical protein
MDRTLTRAGELPFSAHRILQHVAQVIFIPNLHWTDDRATMGVHSLVAGFSANSLLRLACYLILFVLLVSQATSPHGC